MLDTFSFWVSSNLSQQKIPTAEIIGIYFLGTIVLRKYMGLFVAINLKKPQKSVKVNWILL